MVSWFLSGFLVSWWFLFFLVVPRWFLGFLVVSWWFLGFLVVSWFLGFLSQTAFGRFGGDAVLSAGGGAGQGPEGRNPEIVSQIADAASSAGGGAGQGPDLRRAVTPSCGPY